MTEFNDRRPKERQGRLFNPLSVPRRQVHEQTFDEFARSPRSWWHGSDDPDLRELHGTYREQGFHVGTLKAAHERRVGGPYNKGGFLHPVRLSPAGGMQNHPLDSASLLEDEAEDWDTDTHGNHYYRNEYEDPGSVSAIVDDAVDAKTYMDHLIQADRAGQRLGGYQQETLDNYKRSVTDIEKGRLGRRDVANPHVKVHDTELVKTDEVVTRAPKNMVMGQPLGNINKFHEAWNDKTPTPVHRYDYDNTTRPREIAAMRQPHVEQRTMVAGYGTWPNDTPGTEIAHPDAMPEDRATAFHAMRHDQFMETLKSRGLA